MLFRLVVPRVHPASRQRAGVFVAAYALLRDDTIWPHGREPLRALLGWFEEHLLAPSPMPGRAVCWFKPGSNACSRRIWELATLLVEQGHPVARLRTRRPGKVVYEDRYQVAAVPFRDTFVR